MAYKVQHGDSPARIARRFGIPMSSLIGANPHKPTTLVAGQRTWRGLRAGEAVNLPVGIGDGNLGAYAPGSIMGPHATIRRGSSGTDVATWQAFLGLTADGIFGANTEAATRSFQSGHGLTADGVVGPKTWATAQSSLASQTQAAQTLFASRTAPAPMNAPHAQIRQGSTGADVALWQTILGSVTVDGIFGPKTDAATRTWQSKRGLAADGIVGPKTWAAAVGGATAPAAIPAPAAPAVVPMPVSFPVPAPAPTPIVSPVSVAAAAQALAGVDPCYSGNAAMVCAAQAALGLAPDGKYGAGTAAALKKLIPNAPAACSPAPLWWGKKTDNKCAGGALPPPHPSLPATPLPSMPLPATPAGVPTPVFIPTPAPVVIPPATVTATATSPGITPGPAQPAIVAPEEKKISTGALVAGGLGIAALVGVVAVAASGKKGRHTSGKGRGGARRRAPSKKHKRRR